MTKISISRYLNPKLFYLALGRGFTLLEILLVVGIIAILAGIVILAINPTKQLGDARNSQRRADVNTILNAVYQYSIDNGGNFPATISQANCVNVGTNEIATSSATTTAASIDLYSKLVGTSVSSSTYLVAIPRDPLATTTGGAAGTGYVIVKTTGNRITVCAPLAENATTISATR